MVTDKQGEKMLTCQVTGCEFTDNRENMIKHLIETHDYKETEARALYVSHLIKYAEAAGAVTEPDEFRKARNIQEILGDGKISFYPKLPRLDWQELLNQSFVVKDCKIVIDFNGKFGKSSFPLMLVKLEDGREVTTLGSGVAIFNQFNKLNNLRPRPWPVKVNKLIMYQPPDGGDPYYSIT